MHAFCRLVRFCPSHLQETVTPNEPLHGPTAGTAHRCNEAADESSDIPEFDLSQLRIIIDMVGQDFARRSSLPETYFEASLGPFKQSFADTDVHTDLPTFSKTDVRNIMAAVVKWCMESLKHSPAESSE